MRNRSGTPGQRADHKNNEKAGSELDYFRDDTKELKAYFSVLPNTIN